MAVCPSCGEENPGRFAFCGVCGTSLKLAAEPIREERKVVTVLFCDLVGFTARSDNADPEDVRATVRPYQTGLSSEIERFGGTVEKFIGDAIMAVFGAPISHEDDAERAVRSALSMLEAIERINESRPDSKLAVRIGVNTGEALAVLGARPKEGEGLVSGDVVNTASRLQSVAPVGGIVVGEVTYRTTKEIFEYVPLEPVQLKGKAQPVPIFEVKAARSRIGGGREYGATLPFVGREDELELLRHTYHRCLRDASVQLVTVVGEPGVGKSRLVRELASFIDDQHEAVSWRQGQCLPYGEGITFWALGEIVKAQADVLESDGPEQAATKLDAAVQAVIGDPLDREWLRSRLAPLVGISRPEDLAGAERTELFTAWRRYLEAVACRGPLVLLFEDLHWADKALLEFIEYLVDWASDVSVLVVCTARPELYERYPGWGGGKRNSATLSLSPLSNDETARLISALLARSVLPADLQALLLERAGGNPLYAEEFVRMLKDRGLIAQVGGILSITAATTVPFPDSVQALIAARLDTLAPERKSCCTMQRSWGGRFGLRECRLSGANLSGR